ncbi:unnamed protein product [Amoebophrya sp. A25]|nr:unnamed protein product [Amoebophrya sp. A25]|eukprot:GSA25T00004321001.1
MVAFRSWIGARATMLLRIATLLSFSACFSTGLTTLYPPVFSSQQKIKQGVQQHTTGNQHLGQPASSTSHQHVARTSQLQLVPENTGVVGTPLVQSFNEQTPIFGTGMRSSQLLRGVPSTGNFDSFRSQASYTSQPLDQEEMAMGITRSIKRFRAGRHLPSDQVEYFQRVPSELEPIWQAPDVESEDMRKSVDMWIPLKVKTFEELGGAYTLQSGDLCLVWRPTIGSCDYGAVSHGNCYQRMALFKQPKQASTGVAPLPPVIKCRLSKRFQLPHTVRLSMYEASGSRGIWYDEVSSLGWRDMHLVRHPVYLDYVRFVNDRPAINKNVCMQVSPLVESFQVVNFGTMIDRFPEKDGSLNDNCASRDDPEYLTLRGCLRCMNMEDTDEVCEFNNYEELLGNSWHEKYVQRAAGAGGGPSAVTTNGTEATRNSKSRSSSSTAAYSSWDFRSDAFRQSVDPVLVYRQYEGSTGQIAFQIKWRECVERQLWSSAYYKMHGRRLHFVYKMLDDALQDRSNDGSAVVHDLQTIDHWRGWERTYLGRPQHGQRWKFKHVSFGFHGYKKGAAFMTAVQGKNINDIAIYGLAPLLQNQANPAETVFGREGLGVGTATANIGGPAALLSSAAYVRRGDAGASSGGSASGQVVVGNKVLTTSAGAAPNRQVIAGPLIKNTILFDSVCFGGKNKRNGRRISSSIGRVFESLYKRGWHKIQALGSKDLQSAYRFRFNSVRAGYPVFSFVQSDRSDGTRMLEEYNYLVGDTVEVVLERQMDRHGPISARAVSGTEQWAGKRFVNGQSSNFFVGYELAVVTSIGSFSQNVTLTTSNYSQHGGPSPVKPALRLCQAPEGMMNMPSSAGNGGAATTNPQNNNAARTAQRARPRSAASSLSVTEVPRAAFPFPVQSTTAQEQANSTGPLSSHGGIVVVDVNNRITSPGAPAATSSSPNIFRSVDAVLGSAAGTTSASGVEATSSSLSSLPAAAGGGQVVGTSPIGSSASSIGSTVRTSALERPASAQQLRHPVQGYTAYLRNGQGGTLFPAPKRIVMATSYTSQSQPVEPPRTPGNRGQYVISRANLEMRQNKVYEDYQVLRPRLVKLNDFREKRSPYDVGEKVKVCIPTQLLPSSSSRGNSKSASPTSNGSTPAKEQTSANRGSSQQLSAAAGQQSSLGQVPQSCLPTDYRTGYVVQAEPLKIQTEAWGLLEPWNFCGSDFVMRYTDFYARYAPGRGRVSA